MASTAEIEQALSDLEPGQRVRVRLDDGSEYTAVVSEGGKLPVENSDLVPERIERVLVDASSADPE